MFPHIQTLQELDASHYLSSIKKPDDLGGVPQKVQELRSSSSPLLTNKSSQLRGTDQRRWWQWSSSSRQGEVVTATCYRQDSVLLWDVRFIEFQ